MPLLPAFRTAAIAHGRFPDDQRLSPEAIFALVRDLPLAAPSPPQAEVVVAEWRGSNAGKHILLEDLYDEFGLPSLLMCATHEFTPRNTPWLPPALLAMLDAGPIPDVHMFLRLEYQPGEWMTLDATWPVTTAALGLPVNAVFERGVDMELACDADEFFHVPPDTDPWAFRARIEERHVGAETARRDGFIEALIDWLGRATAT